MVITLQYLAVFIIAILLTLFLGVLDSNFYKNYSAKKLHTWKTIFSLILLAAIVYLAFQNFPITLTLIVFVMIIIAVIDLVFLAKKRKQNNEPAGVLVKNTREFLPVLLLVWVIRSFIIQPYRVPTGSLEPTIMAGDFILVKQYAYGLRFPIGNFTMIKTNEPKIGDIALFYTPFDPSTVYIKRVIGTPGDHIIYKDKVLTVNGKQAEQTLIGQGQDLEPQQMPILVNRYSENLNGVKHDIFVRPVGGETDDFDIVVPPGMYFMMGDNRDDSGDSREWGFVPERNLIGQAFRVFMSWDANSNKIVWDRIGTRIH